jgi:homoserine kinase type II
VKQDKQITEIVESLYDIGTVTAVNEIFGGYNSRSFGIEALKDGCAKTYFLRKYKAGMSAGEIRFEHALISHAIKNGFSIAAGIVASVGGETFVQPTCSRSIFAIFDYLDGEDRYTWDNPDLTDAEFKHAGRVLAVFHNAVHDFNPGRLQRTEPPILLLWPRLAEKFAGFVSQKQTGKLQAYYAAHLQSLLDMITCNPFDPIEAEGLPRLPVHCDYHPGNLKWTDERVVGIFDFDWSKMDLRLFDVAMAVIYCCSRWDGDRDGELRCDKCELFIGAYQQQLCKSAGLEPLTSAEQRLLPKMLDIANIYLIHWEVSTYMDTAGVDDDEYLAYLKHNIRLMHWLEDHRAAVIETIVRALS